ncbi:MAG: glucose-6-phosphate isomerase [Candidatus Pelagibacter sp.]|nr:glucose-6-phosphate isomerase [Candidatus Pelagibacter sp.]
MKNKKIIYKNNIQKKYLNLKFNHKLNKRYSNILKDITTNLDTTKNIFHSLSNKFKFNFKTKDLYKFKKFKTVAIIGMGGSILGSEALYYFLKEKIKKNFLFFNDIDEDKLKKLKSTQNLKKILFIVISKSGNTIETLSNFFALQVIKKNSKNIIIISEKFDNPLYSLSQKMKLHHIEHKNYIGGRYSILSEVSMVPAYLMGVNIKRFRKNLLNHFKNKKFLKDSSIMLTNLLKSNKFKNLIFFNYAPRLDKFLYWKQQLIAESLGKKGKGFLPLISKAPRDHHSLLQLYLDGPKDKIFYIFSEKKNNNKKIQIKRLDKRINFLQNKSLDQVKNAQKNAFIETLKKNNIPFREFTIRDFSENILGEFFSYFMLETAIIGKLANINPFDQPAVQQVKINTKKLLV